MREFQFKIAQQTDRIICVNFSLLPFLASFATDMEITDINKYERMEDNEHRLLYNAHLCCISL